MRHRSIEDFGERHVRHSRDVKDSRLSFSRWRPHPSEEEESNAKTACVEVFHFRAVISEKYAGSVGFFIGFI